MQLKAGTRVKVESESTERPREPASSRRCCARRLHRATGAFVDVQAPCASLLHSMCI